MSSLKTDGNENRQQSQPENGEEIPAETVLTMTYFKSHTRFRIKEGKEKSVFSLFLGLTTFGWMLYWIPKILYSTGLISTNKAGAKNDIQGSKET